MQAMIFAAGLGTRLKEETVTKPKALVQIGKNTFLQNAIEKLKSEGVTSIVINVHHFAEQIISFLDEHDFGIQIEISDESEQLLDTGGGLKKAASLFSPKEPVLMYNVDVISNLSLKQVLNVHIESGALATLVVRNRETQRYLKFDSDNNLVGWLNKKTNVKKISRQENFETATEMAFSGIHVVSPEIFCFMPGKEKFPIMDLYLELAKSKTIKGYFDTSQLWIDVGKPLELKRARELFS